MKYKITMQSGRTYLIDSRLEILEQYNRLKKILLFKPHTGAIIATRFIESIELVG